MKILLTNDDGIYADGITELGIKLVDEGHTIVLVAPDRERSASGHAITINDPLRARKIVRSALPDVPLFRVSGTPADCVKLALEKLINFEPDLVISGINHGPNLGFEIFYSGTVSAAIEGWMLGYPSMAVSMAYNEENNFKKAAEYIAKFIKSKDVFKLNSCFLMNINFPEKLDDNSKICITKLGKTLYSDTFDERTDPMGNTYYWLSGSNKDIKDDGTDIAAYLSGNISITPLKIDLTDSKQLIYLQENFLKNYRKGSENHE
ncbi:MULTISPECIES: 5'/3'-nucleotidase SurE [unclassified Halanaerobium]|uniref:5'/3'-nucleotidase SurE n=1 Tax=unclassified Halanaerobium TaxID=2641197 RepID=UPI000DF25F9D|nr:MULTISPECIES: 5'/3'-nucleotidase SurE [unclassified Halanaerobium]RCW51524.1 5'-nucleotidase /3'-nucleotidase /exopolyphosphatase [Halanaerobium sp. MA284_MarDTE_T2]RCW89312.1 5'-nucleotidase /3'-nucleotidase /exopolyphosphatase [Halanaerobium sp. DL-01]